MSVMHQNNKLLGGKNVGKRVRCESHPKNIRANLYFTVFSEPLSHFEIGGALWSKICRNMKLVLQIDRVTLIVEFAISLKIIMQLSLNATCNSRHPKVSGKL